jgi:hypothetical protein
MYTVTFSNKIQIAFLMFKEKMSKLVIIFYYDIYL